MKIPLRELTHAEYNTSRRGILGSLVGSEQNVMGEEQNSLFLSWTAAL